ncbi:MAG: TIGR04053 family radical SAM/SPASM domain-containing protein [Chloroflexi bacterium]|nr:TIGR04053 family radical SAM/SPASM domain-containing protein [Chloroflexota bacterium]
MPRVDVDRDPVVVFWEMTRACALACEHCRAEAQPKRHPLELSTDEGFKLLDRVAAFDHKPIIVLSGGDPFMRRDLFDIVERGVELGLTVSVSPSATALATKERFLKLVDLGVSRVSFSLDGPDAETHDVFRGFPGTFDRTLEMFRAAREVGLEFQVNTTITKRTRDYLPRMAELVAREGAVLWDLFLLVPVGRGLEASLMSPEQHEETFNWVVSQRADWPFMSKTTLGQPFRRVAIQRRIRAEGRNVEDMSPSEVRGMWPGPVTNDGKGIFFVSHMGNVYPSGFLPYRAGNVRTDDPVALYRNAPIFRSLRDPASLKGKCGVCPFNGVCGGSRARAYAMTGDPLGAEPCCPYVPAAVTAA